MNKIYPKAFERMLKGGLNLDSANVVIWAVQIGAGHYVYADSDEFLTAIASGDRLAKSSNLGTKTITTVSTDDVLFDADDPTITFAGGSLPAAGAYVLGVDTGSAATSYLIKYIDTDNSLPLTPPPGGGTLPVPLNASGVLRLNNP